MDDRVRVVLTDLAVGVSALLIQRRFFDALDETPDSRSVAVGVLEAFCYQYVVEHGPLASALDSYVDRVAVGFARYLFDRLLSWVGVSSVSMGFGTAIGFVCYRLVFGIVFDVPESRFERPSLLNWWRRRSERDSSG